LVELVPYYFLLRKFNFVHTEKRSFVGLLGFWTSSIICFTKKGKKKPTEREIRLAILLTDNQAETRNCPAEFTINILRAVLGTYEPHGNARNSVSRGEVSLKPYLVLQQKFQYSAACV
jgi:hypothetical protein